MAGAGWESQPVHRAPSSVTVEAETSMSRQEGPVGRRKSQSCECHPDEAPGGGQGCGGSYPLWCRSPEAGGAAPPRGEKRRPGSVFSRVQLALCRKLAQRAPGQESIVGISLVRTKHPAQVPTITTYIFEGFVFPFSKEAVHLGNWHCPLPMGNPQLTPECVSHLLPRPWP